jgi:hypothetical protein
VGFLGAAAWPIGARCGTVTHRKATVSEAEAGVTPAVLVILMLADGLCDERLVLRAIVLWVQMSADSIPRIRTQAAGSLAACVFVASHGSASICAAG